MKNQAVMMLKTTKNYSQPIVFKYTNLRKLLVMSSIVNTVAYVDDTTYIFYFTYKLVNGFDNVITRTKEGELRFTKSNIHEQVLVIGH